MRTPYRLPSPIAMDSNKIKSTSEMTKNNLLCQTVILIRQLGATSPLQLLLQDVHSLNIILVSTLRVTLH